MAICALQTRNNAINKLLKGVTVSDEDLKKYYDEHKEQFEKPVEFEAAHILVEDEDQANNIKKELDQEEISFEEALESVKQNSRRYAKRQLTWFRNRMEAVHWFDVSNDDYLIKIEQLIEDFRK